MRAEFAMSTRRLEMSFKTFREKAAVADRRDQPQPRGAQAALAERSERHEALTRLEVQCGEISAPNCASARTSCSVLTEKLDEAEKLLEQRALEIEKLGRMYDDASFSASNRQIELVARESEIEKLSNDMRCCATSAGGRPPQRRT